MREATMIGVDLAKNVFHLHGVNNSGKAVFKKRLSRGNFKAFLASAPRCLIVMEACSSAHYWGRLAISLGHRAQLISPQHVKPFVKTNKNDANDAEAICEAAVRPNMRFVSIKTPEQQDLQTIHRVRSSCIKRRTALANEIRGHLAERGIIFPRGINKLRQELPILWESQVLPLSLESRDLLSDLYAEILALDERIDKYTCRLRNIANKDEDCLRLMTIPGIGVITATIIKAVAGDGKAFKNGRQFSAWLGLVPRQHSTGGKNRLLGISKRGDTYVRTQLIQGAHNLVRRAASKWLGELKERRGYNRACVAQANKTARIAWAVLAKKEVYRAE